MTTEIGQRDILLTGATGFIGGELVGRLFERRPEATLYCLIRARDEDQLAARRAALLTWAGLDPGTPRVMAIRGDVALSDLGLGADAAGLAASIGEIFHVAASTKFDLPLDDARAANRDGAAHVLDFARRAREHGGLRRLHHVSTAYVAGDAAGHLRENEPAVGTVFRNTYEQSKWEAEQVLDPDRAGVPVTCYRPSIVVGDSRSGRTLHFRVLYDPMRWVYGGKLDALPCRPEVRLDVVPIDYVCDALLALGERPESAGETYHLSCGPEGALSIAEIIEAAVAEANRYHRQIGADPIEAPNILSPDTPGADSGDLAKLMAAAAAVVGQHVPYMLTEQLFDTARTRQALGDSGVSCPPFRAYFDRIVRYGIERSFGAR